MSNNHNTYTLFVDESGVAGLNHKGKFFVLSCVLIKNTDVPIIDGYLGILKTEYFRNNGINIHTTDIFERCYQKYRQLCKPKNRRNAFLTQLNYALQFLPFRTATYIINKDILRKKINYKPYPKKKASNTNYDLPYELASRQALLDYVTFLKINKAYGEIVIESRQFNDNLFVGYFDDLRKAFFTGGVINSYAKDSAERINSLSIANKDYIHSGLELADIGSYSAYRKYYGDSLGKVGNYMGTIKGLYNITKKKSYVKHRGTIIITDENPNDVKPSKLI